MSEVLLTKTQLLERVFDSVVKIDRVEMKIEIGAFDEVNPEMETCHEVKDILLKQLFQCKSNLFTEEHFENHVLSSLAMYLSKETVH